jgi:hypothetical protein
MTMRSSPKRRKTLHRAGLVSLIILGLIASGTVAWGHGGLPGGSPNRVHTCVLPIGPLRLPRVIAETESCIGVLETGLDFPQNGTLIGVDIGPAVTTTLPMPAVDTQSAPVTAECPNPATGPPSHAVIGATISHSTDATVSTSIQSTPTAWQVTLIAPTPGPKTVVVSPICMRLFQQQ